MRRTVARGAALAAALALGACQQLGLSATGKPAPTPAPQPAPLPADPVLAFVASAGPGQSTTLADAADGTIVVRLDRQYDSADGVVCRRFTVTLRRDIRTRVACRLPAGWQLDPILGGGTAR